MGLQFKGELSQLQEIVENCGFKGDWSEDAAGKYTFREHNGGIVNWWPATSTLFVQGKAAVRQVIEATLTAAIAEGEVFVSAESSPTVASRKQRSIFIVHGHDSNARDQLELALRRLGVEPFILMNSSGNGKTLIEALEGHIGRDYSSDFGIVLMTPDDWGYSIKDGDSKGEPRARQNVILETGMLISSLTRERMALIVKGHVELPSDLQGIIRLGYNDHIREIVPKLCQRLKGAGFDISADAISIASV